MKTEWNMMALNAGTVNNMTVSTDHMHGTIICGSRQFTPALMESPAVASTSELYKQEFCTPAERYIGDLHDLAYNIHSTWKIPFSVLPSLTQRMLDVSFRLDTTFKVDRYKQ